MSLLWCAERTLQSSFQKLSFAAGTSFSSRVNTELNSNENELHSLKLESALNPYKSCLALNTRSRNPLNEVALREKVKHDDGCYHRE
jgi:hypothetical protein